MSEEPSPVAAVGIDVNPKYVISIKGVPHVRFDGVLDVAHRMGLKSVTLEVLELGAERAVFMAKVVMKDGGEFTDVGDATPRNVTPRVAAHYIRVAGTRAKARALRLACNIDMVAVEELMSEGEGEGEEEPSDSKQVSQARVVPMMAEQANDAVWLRSQITRMMQDRGKTTAAIAEYWKYIEQKYQADLPRRLPGILREMREASARDKKEAVHG